MLLRSSSSPVLESLLAPNLQVFCHSDHPSAADSIKQHENPPGAEAFNVPKCLSFTSCRGTTSTPLTTATSLTHFDPQPHPALKACSSFGSSIRKVFSESDLCILPDSSTPSTPAQLAANSLLQEDNNAKGCPSSDLDVAASARSPHGHVKKGRMPLALGRWRSLGPLPSELLSVLFDTDSAICEEGELTSQSSSATTGDEEERESRICGFDKLALPVGSPSNVKVEQVNDTTDVRFALNMLDDSRLSRSTSDTAYVHGIGGDDPGGEDPVTGLEVNLSKQDADDVVFSGRQKPRYVGGQGSSCSFERGIGTAVLVPQERSQASQPTYVYHGDTCETALLGAGGGGRGIRPPTSTGGGRGGGEAGGCGGRNSDPTELHYQSMLKNSPGNPLILQNYAQYLAEVKHDYPRAEEFYQRAILVNPSDGELLGQYAKLLWEVQQDRKRAATYFERAVQAAPDNSYVMAAYASFLWSAEEEEQESAEDVNGSNPAHVPASFFSLVSAGPL